MTEDQPMSGAQFRRHVGVDPNLWAREFLRAYAQVDAVRTDYDERRKVFNDKPRHDWSSHSSDAWRYLSLAWREMQPAKPPAPPVDTWTRAWQRSERSDAAESWRVA